MYLMYEATNPNPGYNHIKHNKACCGVLNIISIQQ